jgi:hypothetical protein
MGRRVLFSPLISRYEQQASLFRRLHLERNIGNHVTLKHGSDRMRSH